MTIADGGGVTTSGDLTVGTSLQTATIDYTDGDVAITVAGSSGNFELNVFRPLIAFNILQSILLLGDASKSFTENAILGLKPNLNRIQKNLHDSLMLVTALNPFIGYDKASEVAKKAYVEDITLREAIIKLNYLTGEEFDRLVKPEEMIYPKKK